MKFCPSCQLEYDDKYEFCHQCGSKLQMKEDRSFCHHCGKKIVTDGDFCPFCGKSLVYAKPIDEIPPSIKVEDRQLEIPVVQRNTGNDTNRNNYQLKKASQQKGIKKDDAIITGKDKSKEDNKFVKSILNIIWLVFFFAIATLVSKGTKEAIGNWDKMSILIMPAVSIAVGIYSYTKAERNKLSQAIGFAVMPGLFLGALAWCLLTGQFGIIFIDIAIVGLVIACIYFGVIRFK